MQSYQLVEKLLQDIQGSHMAHVAKILQSEDQLLTNLIDYFSHYLRCQNCDT